MPTASHTLSLSSLFRKAWCLARAAARRFGAPARQFIAASMRQCWAEAKAQAAEVEAMRQRVLAAVAGLAAEAAEMERLTAEWGARLGLPGYGPRAAAAVLPFRLRRPVVPAAPARRAA